MISKLLNRQQGSSLLVFVGLILVVSSAAMLIISTSQKKVKEAKLISLKSTFFSTQQSAGIIVRQLINSGSVVVGYNWDDTVTGLALKPGYLLPPGYAINGKTIEIDSCNFDQLSTPQIEGLFTMGEVIEPQTDCGNATNLTVVVTFKKRIPWLPFDILTMNIRTQMPLGTQLSVPMSIDARLRTLATTYPSGTPVTPSFTPSTTPVASSSGSSVNPTASASPECVFDSADGPDLGYCGWFKETYDCWKGPDACTRAGMANHCTGGAFPVTKEPPPNCDCILPGSSSGPEITGNPCSTEPVPPEPTYVEFTPGVSAMPSGSAGGEYCSGFPECRQDLSPCAGGGSPPGGICSGSPANPCEACPGSPYICRGPCALVYLYCAPDGNPECHWSGSCIGEGGPGMGADCVGAAGASNSCVLVIGNQDDCGTSSPNPTGSGGAPPPSGSNPPPPPSGTNPPPGGSGNPSSFTWTPSFSTFDPSISWSNPNPSDTMNPSVSVTAPAPSP